MTFQGKLEVSSWQEDERDRLDPADNKTTSAAIGYHLTGDVNGDAVSDVVMQYLPDGTASVLGLFRFHGSVGGKSGGFACETVGGYDGTSADGRLTVIVGSGTGDFSGLTGSGTTTATSDKASFSFDLDL
jgi:hypothetical protein